MPPFSVDALGLAVALVRGVAPSGATVEAGVAPDSAWKLPLVIVGASAPRSVANGPNGASADFAISVRCYSESRAEASTVCHAVYGGLIQAWRDGVSTPFGWISRISNDSTQPTLVQSDLEADNLFRFDCVLNVIARH